jgi:Na+-driven multidrug efflux pump
VKSSKQWDWVVSESVIWILIFMGLGGLVVLVPALAGELSDQFSEYRGDFLILVFLLGVPVVIGLGILGLILLLLRRIRLDRMLTEVSYKPIRWLVRLAATLAGSFALIGVWLSIKNTLPPVIAIVLAVFALISLAVALVTHVLFGLLKQAVAHSDELREVI